MTMKVSLPGMFANAEIALRSSRDSLACMSAYCYGELIDNLRALKEGRCTVDEFFATYVFETHPPAEKCADRVRKQNYLCMQGEVDEEDDDG